MTRAAVQALAPGAWAFSRVGACGGSAKTRGLVPALAPGARACSRVGACGGSAKTRGFTLIEVLVVVAIVAALLGALTLAAGGSLGRRLENAAQRAEMLVARACERALVTGSDIGFRVEDDGLRFGYLRAEGWVPLGDDPGDELRPRPLGDGIELTARVDGRELDPADAPEQAQLACFASGELTPFALRIALAGMDERWLLRGELDGRLQLERQIDAAR